MGSDNLPTEQNAAAIYSGLGLDVSPSLSGSEGMSGEPQGYSPLESPTSILNVRVSLFMFRYSLLYFERLIVLIYSYICRL